MTLEDISDICELPYALLPDWTTAIKEGEDECLHGQPHASIPLELESDDYARYLQIRQRKAAELAAGGTPHEININKFMPRVDTPIKRERQQPVPELDMSGIYTKGQLMEKLNISDHVYKRWRLTYKIPANAIVKTGMFKKDIIDSLIDAGALNYDSKRRVSARNNYDHNYDYNNIKMPKIIANPDIYTTKQLADKLGVHRGTIKTWLQAGKIPIDAVESPGKFKRREIDSLIDRGSLLRKRDESKMKTGVKTTQTPQSEAYAAKPEQIDTTVNVPVEPPVTKSTVPLTVPVVIHNSVQRPDDRTLDVLLQALKLVTSVVDYVIGIKHD
jgi:excisionase family DNA binding protein